MSTVAESIYRETDIFFVDYCLLYRINHSTVQVLYIVSYETYEVQYCTVSYKAIYLYNIKLNTASLQQLTVMLCWNNGKNPGFYYGLPRTINVKKLAPTHFSTNEMTSPV